MFAFAALWTVFVAMVRGIDATISHGQTTVTLNNPDNPAPPEPKGDGQADDDLEED